MSQAKCARCGRPTDAAICHIDAQELAEVLTAAAGHAEDAWTVIARQTRYGTGSRGGRERPLPVDLAAAADFGAVENTLTTWIRHVVETRPPLIGPACASCGHSSCNTIRDRQPPPTLADAIYWLARQVDWLRRRPEAEQAFDELHDACRVLARMVDRPGTAGLRLVGMCDCGRILYAPHGRDTVTCKSCGASWHVERSQQILRQALDERLVTAAEAAHLGAFLDTDRTQKQIRALLDVWARRGRIAEHSDILIKHRHGDRCEPGCDTAVDRLPTYRFGEIAARMAETPRRHPREGTAA